MPHCAVWMCANKFGASHCGLSGQRSAAAPCTNASKRTRSKFCQCIKRKPVCWSIRFGQDFARHACEASKIHHPNMCTYKLDLQQTFVNSFVVLRRFARLFAAQFGTVCVWAGQSGWCGPGLEVDIPAISSSMKIIKMELTPFRKKKKKKNHQ